MTLPIIILSILLVFSIVICINLYLNLRDSNKLFNKLQLEFSNLSAQNEKNLKFAQECSAKHISLTGQYSQLNTFCDVQVEKIEKLNDRINELLEKQDREIKAARIDSTTSQKSIIKGKISENLAVLLPCWKWSVADSRFLGGSPLDFIVYSGLSKDLITDIILVDVKTGNAQLTTRQRQIRDVISKGKVSFETIRLDEKDIE